MRSATTGAAATQTTGTAIAMARMRIAAARGSVTSGDDSTTTGSSVMLAMAQSETTFSLAMTAARSGSRNGTTKATTTVRRRGSDGHAVSATAMPDGRAATAASRTGTAT